MWGFVNRWYLMLLLLQRYPRAFVHQAVLRAVRICCLNVQPWPIVVIVMLAASNLALKYGWIHTKFTIWQTHSYQIPQAVPLCHRYPGISTIWCSTAKQYVFCAELQVSCLNQLLEPSTFGRWLRGPLRFGPIKLAICQGWNIARKHVALVPCLYWGLGGDLLLVLHTTVVVQTLRFVTWRCTRGGNPNMWGVLLC